MSEPMTARAIILFSHGSSDNEWATPFIALQRRLQARDESVPVLLAFLAPAAPTFEAVVAQMAQQKISEIIVVPLFLARGGHVKSDLPALIKAATDRHGIDFKLLPVIGDVPQLQDAIADWVVSELG